MHITGMTAAGVPPISKRVTLALNKRVNLFVGPNASGKSTLLRLIQEHVHDPYPHSWFLESIAGGIDANRLAVSEDWREPENGTLVNGSSPPVVVVGSVRQPLPTLSDSKIGCVETASGNEILSGDFSGINVKQGIEALLGEVWEMEPDRSSPYISLKGDEWKNYYSYPERYNLLKARDIIDDCAKMICGEVIRGSSSHNYVPGPDVRGYLQGPRGAEPIDVHFYMGVDTNDIRNFSHLSAQDAPSESAYHQDHDSLPIYAGYLRACVTNGFRVVAAV